MNTITKCKRMYRFIQQVKAGSGYNTVEAYHALKNARSLGLSYERYIELNGWSLDDEALKKQSSLDALRKTYAKQLSEAAGITLAMASKKLAKGRKYGLSGELYLKYRAWELTDNELVELKQVRAAYNQKLQQTNQWYIDVVKERTGWSQTEAKSKMDNAIKKGYNYRKFITSALYKLTDEELENVGPFVKKPGIPVTQQQISAQKERTRNYRETIKKEMGWNDGRLELEYLKSKTACGASFDEYYRFGLYKLSPEEGKKYMTLETHLKMQLRYIDFNGKYHYFENKALFNTHFKEFVKRRWFTNENLTFEEFEEKIKGLNKIIYKPVEGIEGIGIEVYDVNNSVEENKAVYKAITENGLANIEEFLVQYHELSEFWPNSVNTIRMMSFCKDGQGHVLNAIIKFGTKANVDNYYQGGIGAGIDIETGTICTNGVNSEGTLFEVHPVSGKKFKGFKIPNWNKIVKACEKAASFIPEMPYIGWDIAINSEGEPEFIEGNHNQAAYVVQYPFAVSNQEGRRHTIEPYLWFN